MPEDFAGTVRATLVAAKNHAARLSDLPEREHRRLCEQLEARVGQLTHRRDNLTI
jgi:hypothetical protein